MTSSPPPFDPPGASQPLPTFLLDADPGNEGEVSEEELALAGLSGALALNPRGKEPRVVDFEIVRELTPEDLPFVNAPRGSGAPPTGESVKLRSSHHQVAQLVASGRRQADIALITGYTQSYLSTLSENPAFKALVAHYAGVEELKFTDEMARLKALGVQATEVLQERLAEREDEFTVRELNEIIDLTIVRPNVALAKATGQVAAAQAAPRAFEVVFRASRASSAASSRPIIEGEIERSGGRT